MIWLIEAAKVCLTLFSFLYASYSDYKTREVSNSVWILFAPPAFALTFAELFLFDFSALPFFGLCFGLTAAFAIILFYAGGFGGADAKALMCLALALPFHPQELFPTPLSGDVSPFHAKFFPLNSLQQLRSTRSLNGSLPPPIQSFMALENWQSPFRRRTGKRIYGQENPGAFNRLQGFN
jgi:hypothetical protein